MSLVLCPRNSGEPNGDLRGSRDVLEGLKNWLSSSNRVSSDLGRALGAHCQSYFYNENACFSHWSPALKEKHSAELHRLVQSAAMSDSPSHEVRVLLCDFVISCTNLLCASLTELDKREHPIFCVTPYISGELYTRIDDVVPYIDELAAYKKDHPDYGNQDLINFANNRSGLLLFYCNGINMAQAIIENELAPEVNWYSAFIEASMVSSEDLLRKNLSLPSLLPDKDHGFYYLGFTDCILSGQTNPLAAWTETWPNLYLYGYGPKPVSAKYDST